jgi:hypothetical protein
MTTVTANSADAQAVSGLVSGIVADARELLTQQVSLVRAEIKTESRRAVTAGIFFAIGLACAVPALMLLCDMLVFLLHDDAGVSLWGAYGIVGALLAIAATILIAISVRRFEAFHAFPDQSVEAFKENVRWTTNPK